jgi:hypothetical protein
MNPEQINTIIEILQHQQIRLHEMVPPLPDFFTVDNNLSMAILYLRLVSKSIDVDGGG